MNNIIFISDFIEGKPVVASVRYNELLRYIVNNNKVFVLNDIKYGKDKSIYSEINLKYVTSDTRFTGQIGAEVKQRGKLEKILRNDLVLKLWRTIKFSNFLFNHKNKEFFKNLQELLNNNKIDIILVTVPDIYSLYIVKYLKNRYSSIPIIIEVRDIINHSIGKGNPSSVYKSAENIITKKSDGIIALTETIKNYYQEISNVESEIKVIKNGFNSDNFQDSEYKRNLKEKKQLIISHIGSIYKGRNIKDFINGLNLFSQATGVMVKFNIIGVIDADAYSEIKNIKSNSNVEINLVGTVPHEEAINYLKNCDIAAIITHISGSDYAIPGKTFEYIGACKPIIAISEDKELKSFIEPKYGECAQHNAEDVKDKLIKLLNTEYSFEDRLQFSRKKQAEEIMEFLDRVKTRCNK